MNAYYIVYIIHLGQLLVIEKYCISVFKYYFMLYFQIHILTHISSDWNNNMFFLKSVQ